MSYKIKKKKQRKAKQKERLFIERAKSKGKYISTKEGYATW